MTIAFSSPYGSLHREDEERPAGLGYGARIDDLWVRLATSREYQMTLRSQDQLASRQASTSNPYEETLAIGYQFSRQELTGGEGLPVFPRSNPITGRDIDPTRFFASCNMDVRHESTGVQLKNKLSHEYESWYTAAASITAIGASSSKLYVAAGNFVYQFDDDTDATPDTSTDFSQAVVALSVAENDAAACLLTDGTIKYKPIGTSTWTTVPEQLPGDHDGIQDLWLVKDRIIAWNQDTTDTAAKAELYELGLAITGTPASPNFDAVKTVIDTFHGDVLTVVDAGIAILASIDDGTVRSYVPQTDTSGSAPVLTVRGQTPMPEGEVAIQIGHNLGVLVILTDTDASSSPSTVTAYAAQMLDERFDYVIGNLQEIRSWDGATNTVVGDPIAATRDELIWIIEEDDGDSYLWRYSLATTGVFRHSKIATGEVSGLAYWRERALGYNGTALYRRADSYHDEGHLIFPLVTFGLDTEINWLVATFQADDIADGEGAQAELYISTDSDALTDSTHPSWQLIARYSNSANSAIEAQLEGLVSRRATLMVKLYSNTAGAGTPSWSRVGLRGIPTYRDWVLELPVSISDMVEAPGRMPIQVPGLGNDIHTELLRFSGQNLEVRVLDPPFLMRGVVNASATPVMSSSDRGGAGYVCVVQILGTLLEESGGSQTALADELVGILTPGQSILAVGQSGVVT